MGELVVRLDGGGPRTARCPCPVTGTCVHVLLASRWVRDGLARAAPWTRLAELLGLDPLALCRSAGIAATRLAAASLAEGTPGAGTRVTVSGRQVEISWPGAAHPVVYVAGGGLDGMLPPARRSALHLEALCRVFLDAGRTWTWPPGVAEHVAALHRRADAHDRAVGRRRRGRRDRRRDRRRGGGARERRGRRPPDRRGAGCAGRGSGRAGAPDARRRRAGRRVRPAPDRRHGALGRRRARRVPRAVRGAAPVHGRRPGRAGGPGPACSSPPTDTLELLPLGCPDVAVRVGSAGRHPDGVGRRRRGAAVGHGRAGVRCGPRIRGRLGRADVLGPHGRVGVRGSVPAARSAPRGGRQPRGHGRVGPVARAVRRGRCGGSRRGRGGPMVRAAGPAARFGPSRRHRAPLRPPAPAAGRCRADRRGASAPGVGRAGRRRFRLELRQRVTPGGADASTPSSSSRWRTSSWCSWTRWSTSACCCSNR